MIHAHVPEPARPFVRQPQRPNAVSSVAADALAMCIAAVAVAVSLVALSAPAVALSALSAVAGASLVATVVVPAERPTPAFRSATPRHHYPVDSG